MSGKDEDLGLMRNVGLVVDTVHCILTQHCCLRLKYTVLGTAGIHTRYRLEHTSSIAYYL